MGIEINPKINGKTFSWEIKKQVQICNVSEVETWKKCFFLPKMAHIISDHPRYSAQFLEQMNRGGWGGWVLWNTDYCLEVLFRLGLKLPLKQTFFFPSHKQEDAAAAGRRAGRRRCRVGPAVRRNQRRWTETEWWGYCRLSSLCWIMLRNGKKRRNVERSDLVLCCLGVFSWREKQRVGKLYHSYIVTFCIV